MEAEHYGDIRGLELIRNPCHSGARRSQAHRGEAVSAYLESGEADNY